MENQRCVLLYRDGPRVRATEVSHVIGDPFPPALSLDGREYRLLDSEDTFIFWDEIFDRSGRMIGYTFLAPESPTFLTSSLLRGPENVVDDGGDISILLRRCDDPRVECVQGFGSEVYHCTTDPLNCVLLIQGWDESPIGFDLTRVAVTLLE